MTAPTGASSTAGAVGHSHHPHFAEPCPAPSRTKQSCATTTTQHAEDPNGEQQEVMTPPKKAANPEHGQHRCPQPHTEPICRARSCTCTKLPLAQTQPSVSAAHPRERRERCPPPPTSPPSHPHTPQANKELCTGSVEGAQERFALGATDRGSQLCYQSQGDDGEAGKEPEGSCINSSIVLGVTGHQMSATIPHSRVEASN